MTRPFIKMQAVGNDFVVIEESEWGADTDWATVAIQLCDRHFGVGGDGLLVICPSSIADIRMRMFNPDGTEDMCGNGLRCVVRFAAERQLLTGKEQTFYKPLSHSPAISGTVETLVGVRSVGVLYRVVNNVRKIDDMMTEMGPPGFTPSEIPMAIPTQENVIAYPLVIDGHGTITASSVNTGSTHTVIWVAELPDDETFFSISPKIEHHPFFPSRTSVIWAKPDGPNNSPDHLQKIFQVRIWERGVGETLGCGTGACAVVVLAATEGKLATAQSSEGTAAIVKSSGGELSVRYRALVPGVDGADHQPEVWLSGLADTVFQGTIAD